MVTTFGIINLCAYIDVQKRKKKNKKKTPQFQRIAINMMLLFRVQRVEFQDFEMRMVLLSEERMIQIEDYTKQTLSNFFNHD